MCWIHTCACWMTQCSLKLRHSIEMNRPEVGGTSYHGMSLMAMKKAVLRVLTLQTIKVLKVHKAKVLTQLRLAPMMTLQLTVVLHCMKISFENC